MTYTTRLAFETRFERYRYLLVSELQRLESFRIAFEQVDGVSGSRRTALTLAPDFFSTARGAMLTSMILWTSKLLFPSKRSTDVTIHQFLRFISSSQRWFTEEHYWDRTADEHTRTERPEVSHQQISAHMQRLDSLAICPSLKIRRDKYHAHFSKRYFFNRGLLHEEAAIRAHQVEEAIGVLIDTVNYYSHAYDGQTYTLDRFANGLPQLLDAASHRSGSCPGTPLSPASESPYPLVGQMVLCISWMHC